MAEGIVSSEYLNGKDGSYFNRFGDPNKNKNIPNLRVWTPQ